METMGRFNAASYFVDRHANEGREGRVAIECRDERITYGQLLRKVNQLGNALRHSLEVRREERVLLLLLDVPEFACSFFGSIKIGAVPVPVNTLLKPHDYEYLLNDSRARVAIVSEPLLPAITQIPRERLSFLEHIVVCGPPHPETISWTDLTDRESGDLSPAITGEDDVAFWLYSSGSTGPPKGCVHLQHDMVVATEVYARGILKITQEDRFFSAAKLFFAYGLGNALYFPLSVGATSILLALPPSPANVYSAIEKQRPTLFFSVPSNYAALLDFRREGADFDLSSIRAAVSAGEALPAALFERFKARFGVEILDGIGSTEALHIFISNRPGAIHPGSSGQAVPGCDCRLLNEESETVNPGEIGTLWVKHDAACSHYWNQHQRTKDAIHGQWLSTGDKYRQDAEGYFWYAGRSDDMLKVSGAWVSPIEIEAVLMEHDLVAEAAVVGRKDKDDLVKPVAWVVLRENFIGTPELARALQEFIVSRLPVYKRPRWVEFTSALPKTATGKIQRYRLRENYATGHSQGATADGVDASCAPSESADQSPTLHRFTEDLRLRNDQNNTKSS
jgi:benzoate-CoA ligase family protein